MMNLYLINHIIQFYPFYFHKKPELMEIFSGLKILKNFPHPVGNLCSEVMDNTLNEIMFHGISFVNRLRQEYFLDILDKKLPILDVNETLFIFRLLIDFINVSIDKNCSLYPKIINKHWYKLMLYNLLKIVYNSHISK